MLRLSYPITGLLMLVFFAGCKSMSSVPTGVSSSMNKVKSVFVEPEPNETQARELFAQAELQFNAAAQQQGDQRTAGFSSAAALYKQAAELSPATPLEEDALMMAAESHFFADEYVEAGDGYDELVAAYSRTRHMDKVGNRRFQIAQYWLAKAKSSRAVVPNLTDDQFPTLDTFGYAEKMLNKIRFDDSTGKLADDATMAAGIANFEKGKYGAADEMFSDIRRNFPSSEHQFQAHLLGLKSKQMMYAGPEYSGTVLDESEKLVRQMFALFPNQIDQHRDYLNNALKDIRLKKANREFVMAKFYDNRAEYGAARLYYAKVAKEFSDTSLGSQSQQRLQEIAGLPSEPEQKLKWLESAFPEDNGAREKPLLARETPLLRR